MQIYRTFKPLRVTLFAIVAFGLVNPAVAKEEPVFTTFVDAQHLLCLRNGKVAVDRDPVFRLKVAKTAMTEEYEFRDGRIGAAKSQFRLRPGGPVSCTVTPSESETAKPYHEFEGVNELTCADNGILIVSSVMTENLIERGTERSVIYEYRLHNGPPAKQTVVLSPDGAKCTVRFVSMGDAD